MSGTALEYVMERLEGSTKARMIALTIAHHVNVETGRAFPGQKRLATISGLSERSVRSAIDELINVGLYSVSERRNSKGNRMSFEYDLLGYLGWLAEIRKLAKGRKPCTPSDDAQIDDGKPYRQDLPQGNECENPTGKNCNPYRQTLPPNLRIEPLSFSKEKESPLSDEKGQTETGSPSKPRKRINYTPEFETFWKAYPTNANMPKASAFKDWARLDAADQQAATDSLPAYRKHLAKETWLKPVYAERYLKQRRFDGYASEANDIDWAKCCNAAMQSRQWSRMFGPLPGQPGCRVPPELVTPELVATFQNGRAAA